MHAGLAVADASVSTAQKSAQPREPARSACSGMNALSNNEVCLADVA